MENSEDDEEDNEEEELKGAMIQGEEVAALSLLSKKSVEEVVVEVSADEVSRLSARAAVNKEVPPKKLNRLSSAKVSVT